MSESPPRRVAAGIIIPGRPLTARLVFGIAIIVVGVLFTLDNLGIASAGEVLRWWPVVLIGYGASRLFGFSRRPNLSAGLLFTLGGAWMLLHNLGLISVGLGVLWPLLLVLVGISMVSAATRRRRVEPEGLPGAGLNAFAFWSSNERRIVSSDFRGGEVTAVMGGHDIDLRNARITDGPATLDLLVWMGGVDLFVPEDWQVTNQAVVVMGAIQDQTRSRPAEPKGHLILHGLVLMGAVEIKN